MKRRSLLQRISVATFKELMSNTPLSLMSYGSEYLRSTVQNALTMTTGGRFDVFRISEKIEVIGFDLEHVVNKKDLSSYRILVYIHGGGFIVRDCADLIIAERLLPLIKEHPDMPNNVVIVSLLYPLAKAGVNNAEAILTSLLDGIDVLRRGGARIDGIIGDSAGGYLAIQVAERLTSKVIPKLCLMSPWVNLDSKADSYIRNKHCDFLDLRFIKKARERYLNRNPNHNKDADTNMKVFQDDSGGDVDKSDSASEFMKSSQEIQASLVGGSATPVSMGNEQLAQDIVVQLKQRGIKVIAFDMDQCLVNAHSRGSMKRQPAALTKFYGKVTTGFKVLARVAHKHGLKLAVATHSDENEYFTSFKSQQEYIMGTELVSLVLNSSVPELSYRFYIIAYNPLSRMNFNPNEAHKKLHIRRIAQHYNVHTKEIILFDDDQGNVSDTNDEFMAIQVNPDTGLVLKPIWNRLTHNGSRLHYFDPSTLSTESLSRLPSSRNVQIIVGTEEMFYDDCVLFGTKLNQLTQNGNHNNNGSDNNNVVDMVIANEWHVYPIFWRSILNRAFITLLFAPLLFLIRFIENFFMGVGKKARTHNYSFSKTQIIDSEHADVAINRIATFLYCHPDQDSS